MDLDCSDFQEIQKIKVVLLGDRAVGKSSIIKRFIRNEFDDHQNPTVGIDFMSRQIKYRGHRYKLELWDTAGQEKYRSLVRNYLKDADCALFVYDVNDSRTYKSVIDWIKLFEDYTNRQAVCVIIGNKIDVKGQSNAANESIPVPEPSKQLEQFEHCWVSAKQGRNISALFEKLIENVLATDILTTRILPQSTKTIINANHQQIRCCFL